MSAAVFAVDADRARAARVGDRVRLDGPEGHHAAHVRRLAVGEAVELVDGAGLRLRAAVTAVGRGVVDVRVAERVEEPPPTPRLVVVQALVKGDGAEAAVAAMTEVGVDEVVPWAAARSVVRWRDGDRAGRGVQRWRAAAREAAKQARRATFPVVPELATTAAVADRLAAAAAALVLHESAREPLTGRDLPADGDVVVVVGPEGGLAEEELARFAAAGAAPVRLGPAVLRASTAGIAALSVLSARLGRWEAVSGR